MSVRKEQVLLILVVLMAAWCSSDRLSVERLVPRYNPTTLEYEAAVFREAALVDTDAEAIVRRDFFTEPSETKPLPPRELSFPPRAPLSVCGLPLDPGPDFRHSWLLGVDGAQLPAVELAGAGNAESGGEAGGADPQDVGVGPMTEEQAARLYDRLYLQGLSKPFYGVLESADGIDPFELEQRTDFTGVKVRFRVFSLSKRKLGRTQPFGDGPGLQAVARYRVADTLRNEVTRRVRAVPSGDASRQGDRLALIEWLLEQARTESWIYEEALKQAEDYLQMSGQTLGGRRVMQKVLRAMGNFSEEVKLLEGTTGDNEADAFRQMGLGVISARLGLWVEAERQLTLAANNAPSDARTHATLAEFYRSRGRSVPALAAAKRAQQALGGVQDELERSGVLRTIVGCLLAVGDLERARALAPSEPSYLRGCVAYAAGDLTQAKAAFEQAATSQDANAAQLGRAACLLNAGEWQEAYGLLNAIADGDPLLRHRAWTGLALLYSRTGSFEDALTYCDRALEASPGDAYALYLKGRTLRLMGQYGDAEEALAQCLRVHDDFLHAIVEMSAVQSGLGDNAQGTDRAAAWIAARRYQDRAVALAPEPELELFELQGLRAFQAADRRSARQAFEAARDLVESDAQRGYSKCALAVVAYSRNRVDDAVTTLERVERDLGRDSELGKWAGDTLGAIEVHAQKEALGDSFDRDKLGDLWSCDADKSLGARIRDGKLVFRGTFSTSGSGEVFAERNDAIARGKNFLATSVEVEVLPGTETSESWNGLGIEIHRGRQGVDFAARVGVYQGQPMITVKDGRESDDNQSVRKKLDPGLMRSGEPQLLELRVVPNGAEDARQMILQVYFNNALVHTQQLKLLTRSTNTPLKTLVFTSGNKRAKTDVAFENYRLERRKEVR